MGCEWKKDSKVTGYPTDPIEAIRKRIRLGAPLPFRLTCLIMLFHIANLLTLFSMILALESSYSHKLKGLVPDAVDIAGIVLCAGTFPRDSTCSHLTLTDGACVDFTGKLKTFHKALTGAQITTGYICKLYKNLGCDDAGTATYVVLRGGSYDLATVMVPDGDGTLINFDKQASSIVCNLVP